MINKRAGLKKEDFLEDIYKKYNFSKEDQKNF
jgi:hypothetical protein